MHGTLLPQRHASRFGNASTLGLKSHDHALFGRRINRFLANDCPDDFADDFVNRNLECVSILILYLGL
ncbi:hypothetical protein TNCV_3281631 [Trichonephila clavipes]|nr:hypothetical protein TNCV_3281631 [Trichonephila clavipes]